MSEEERAQYMPEALKQIRGVEGGEPWSDLPFWQSDRLLALDIKWSADDAVIDAIVELAREHELVLYDPQGPEVYLPTDPLPSDEPVPPPTVGDWITIVAICALLLALTYAA